MPTIVHFEIPADELPRARHFYEQLFGWKFEQYPGSDYWTITTSGEHPVGGGMLKKRSPQHPVTNYMDVPSVDDYVTKVEQLGGSLIVPKMAVPGMGWFAVCTDTEGNALGLWQTDNNAR
jgi:predicted enzyme related to lactoylglutathione lyase